ncbi:MAG: C25 family cysteine peptidase, partial [candidate division WOR-3 bacterium]
MTYPARLVCAVSAFFLVTTVAANAAEIRPTDLDSISAPAAPSVQLGPNQARPEPGVVQLVKSGPTGVSCRAVATDFDLAVFADGAQVGAEGWYRLARPGEPDLPGRILLVGLPQQGGVRLAVSVAGTETRTGITVRPAPGFSERPQEGSLDDASGWFPAQPAELVSIETIRGIRVATIRVSPAQYDRSTKTLRLHREVRLDVEFESPGRNVARHDPFDKTLATMLVNGADAIRWSLPRLQPDTINFFLRSPVWCKVVTETTGIYRITPADLKSAGFDPDNIVPSTMKLYSIGRYPVNGPYPDTMVELPVYLKENGDGRFNGSDFLAFYAEAVSWFNPGDTSWRFNPFTPYSCFWLTWGGASGRRMSAVSAAGAVNPSATAPRRLRLEHDSLCPARSGLLWLWRRFYKPADVESGGGPVALRLPQRDTIYSLSGRLLGVAPTSSLVYRPVVLTLNGLLLDTLSVGAKASTPPWTSFSFTGLPTSASARGSRTDTLAFRLISAQESDVYLDYLEIRYAQKLKLSADVPYLEFSYDSAGVVEFSVDGAARDGILLDVTDPYQPREVTDAQVSGGKLDCRLTLAGPTRFCCALKSRLRAPVRVEQRTPGNLRSPLEQADYYIVCPDEFLAVARLYARYRQGNVAGITNAVVREARLSEIYDDYAFGQAEPGAIKRFLQAKQPAYVLLAGDGTYDYKNVLGQSAGPMVPAYELGYDVDAEVYGQTAKALDAWYADLDGNGMSPDLILGRVTVRSAAEFRAFLDKVRRYESQPLGYWAKRIILLADDEYLGDPTKPDGIGFAHINGCEQIANIGYTLLDPAKVYLTEFPIGQRGSGSESALRTELNRGALLWFFFGHGAGFQLNHEMTLHITNSVPSISNGTRTPLAFFGSCGVGRFDDTRYSSIAEELVRKEDGCIITSGATKATSPGGNEMLAQVWLRQLLGYPARTAGMAFFEAWRTNTLYHFFGDPATVLRTPLAGPSPETRPDTFYPGGRMNVR